EAESEKWYLSTDFPSTTIKTEPITDEPPSGLVPSVTLTITAISTPFEKEEPPLEMNAGVDSSCQTVIPKIKLEPHEVDQFLNFSPKEGLSTLSFGLTDVGAPSKEMGNVRDSAGLDCTKGRTCFMK
ncbi:hypothetical protein EI555_009426, partial [Monodon monoceros]